MPNDGLFRLVFTSIFAGILTLSVYRRYRARQTSETIPRAREGKLFFLIRGVFAAVLYLPFFAYMMNPKWMRWSAIPLPVWLRCLGAAGAVATLPLLYWVFSSIGSNISETTLTKKQHVLVSHGPYRWVRHPLYSVATMALISLGLLATNWFMLTMAGAALVAISLWVIPKEETELKRRFGSDYQNYMQRTGRLAPRLLR